MRRLDAHRGNASRVTRRDRRRAHERRRAWRVTAFLAIGPVVWLLWPVKSLLYYIPKWYVELLLGM